MAPPGGVAFAVDASPAPDEVNAAYAWVEWPQRERWRLEAIARTSTWINARDDAGDLVGIVRVLDDGGLHATIWDLVVRPDRQRQGIGRHLVELALERCADRSLVAIVVTPAAAALFESVGFLPESHGHRAMYLRPQHTAGAHSHG
jgi:GNAT superfamily N-acetyltransferase